MTKSKFIGEAGEHYVAYKLARKEMCVGLSLGNTPNIDLLVSTLDGLQSITIQVKSSKAAHRANRYGNEGYEWDVNSGVIGRHSPSFWYVFVDFAWHADAEPDVYVVPSLWVAEFVKSEFSRKMYFLPKKAADLTRNRWDILQSVLEQDPKTIEWASKWDDELLLNW